VGQVVVVAALKLEIPQVAPEQEHQVKGLTAERAYRKTQTGLGAVVVALAAQGLRVPALTVEMVELLQHHPFQAHQ
jgi:hypothetical protein